MARGFKSGGRQKGTPNKRTIETKRLMEEHREALGGDLFKGDSLALFQLCYQNTELPLHVRLDAAKAAARFERPVLAQSEVELNVTARRPEAWSDDELRRFIAEERAKQQQLPAPGGDEPITIDATKLPEAEG